MEGEEEDFAAAAAALLARRRDLWHQGYARTIQFIQQLEKLGRDNKDWYVRAKTARSALQWIIQESNMELLEQLLKVEPEAASMYYENEDNTDVSFGAFYEALEGTGCNFEVAKRLIDSYFEVIEYDVEANQYSSWAMAVVHSLGWEPWFDPYRIPILRLLLKTYTERPLKFAEEDWSPFIRFVSKREDTPQYREMAEILLIFVSEQNELAGIIRHLRTLTIPPWRDPPLADGIVGRRLADAPGRIFAVLNPSFMNLTGLSPELITRFLSFIEPYEQRTMIRILNEILEKKQKDKGVGGALTNSIHQ